MALLYYLSKASFYSEVIDYALMRAYGHSSIDGAAPKKFKLGTITGKDAVIPSVVPNTNIR